MVEGRAPENLYDLVEEASAFIARQTQLRPQALLILGSGLGELANELEGATRIPYGTIPHFPRSTVEGHAGELVIGLQSGRPIAVMRGRFHLYEGYDLWQTTLPVRVARALGARTLLATNAAGGLRQDWQAGDLMLISDHINLPGMVGQNPLRGPNDPRLGPRFPAMLDAYEGELRTLARAIALEQGLNLREGVYAMLSGPTFESAAEMRLLRSIGADAVGMSTAPEVVVARHSGMRALGISLITNLALPDGPAANHEEVLEAGSAARPRFGALLRALIERLPAAGA